MKASTRTIKYIRARKLTDKWALLSKGCKRYVAYLVKTYGYPVKVAIQQAYLFGFTSFPYDYRTGVCLVEPLSPTTFGFKR